MLSLSFKILVETILRVLNIFLYFELFYIITNHNFPQYIDQNNSKIKTNTVDTIFTI